jgi:pantoate--beta-alanine ligase
MQVLHTVADVRSALKNRRVALVPTMGNLHSGHLHLVKQARQHASTVVVSIFVNPLQFGPHEDFDRYPRTLAQDCALLEGHADAVFAPDVAALYPRQGQGTLTTLKAGSASAGLCGTYRPGHFDGVVTVVHALFNLVQPAVALFGEKDYQQLAVIQQMVQDLHVPVEVIGVPTQRETSGLALSSRNQYLSPEQKALAANVYASLQAVANHSDKIQASFEQAAHLQALGFEVQYLEVRSLDLSPYQGGAGVVLVAAVLGKTRLIDNLCF